MSQGIRHAPFLTFSPGRFLLSLWIEESRSYFQLYSIWFCFLQFVLCQYVKDLFYLCYKQNRVVQEAGGFVHANRSFDFCVVIILSHLISVLQKGGVPAAPSGTATLLRLSPNYQFHLRPPLAVTDFRCPRLSWLDGRCVQGPGTYSPRHG